MYDITVNREYSHSSEESNKNHNDEKGSKYSGHYCVRKLPIIYDETVVWKQVYFFETFIYKHENA